VSDLDGLARRIREVRTRIAAAAERSGRAADAVTLVAVGKTHPAPVVDAAVRAGIEHLGENRVQEAGDKKPGVASATWHLIGPLQRNKAGPALEIFDVVHTIDRVSLVDRLELLLDRDWPGRRLPVLLEVNVGGEEQKAGVDPGGAAELLRHAVAQPALEVRGLMTVPPYSEVAEDSRRHYVTLRRLRDRLADDVGHGLPELSMGMSHDFEVAVEEGATLVRVGTAIFGPRA
jgi:pyridoxal phosphate enzyme (YggS family)